MRDKYIRVAEREKRAAENITGMEENEYASHFMCVDVMGMYLIRLKAVFYCYIHVSVYWAKKNDCMHIHSFFKCKH